MKSSYRCLSTRSFLWQLTVLTAASAMVTNALAAAPDPCKLITLAEIEQIVGPLTEAPRATDPESGENTCTFSPATGPSFVDVSLEENADLAAWKLRQDGENIVDLTEFGDGAFANSDFHDFAEVYVQKGSLILRVSVPKGPEAVETVKAITRKALPRL